jgi:hypothetical protein
MDHFYPYNFGFGQQLWQLPVTTPNPGQFGNRFPLLVTTVTTVLMSQYVGVRTATTTTTTSSTRYIKITSVTSSTSVVTSVTSSVFLSVTNRPVPVTTAKNRPRLQLKTTANGKVTKRTTTRMKGRPVTYPVKTVVTTLPPLVFVTPPVTYPIYPVYVDAEGYFMYQPTVKRKVTVKPVTTWSYEKIVGYHLLPPYNLPFFDYVNSVVPVVTSTPVSTGVTSVVTRVSDCTEVVTTVDETSLTNLLPSTFGVKILLEQENIYEIFMWIFVTLLCAVLVILSISVFIWMKRRKRLQYALPQRDVTVVSEMFHQGLMAGNYASVSREDPGENIEVNL